MSTTAAFDQPQLPSERKFGILFACIALFLVIWGAVKGWSTIWLLTLTGAGLLFLVLALLAPSVLAPLNKAWFALGLLLGKVVSPLVLGLIFFVLITPFAVVGRMMGRDELRIKKRHVSTYWIDRPASAPASESFKNQF